HAAQDSSRPTAVSAAERPAARCPAGASAEWPPARAWQRPQPVIFPTAPDRAGAVRTPWLLEPRARVASGTTGAALPEPSTSAARSATQPVISLLRPATRGGGALCAGTRRGCRPSRSQGGCRIEHPSPEPLWEWMGWAGRSGVVAQIGLVLAVHTTRGF